MKGDRRSSCLALHVIEPELFSIGDHAVERCYPGIFNVAPTPARSDLPNRRCLNAKHLSGVFGVPKASRYCYPENRNGLFCELCDTMFRADRRRAVTTLIGFVFGWGSPLQIAGQTVRSDAVKVTNLVCRRR